MVLTGRGSYHSKNEEVERNRSQGCTKKRSPVLKESKLLGKKKKKSALFCFCNRNYQEEMGSRPQEDT